MGPGRPGAGPAGTSSVPGRAWPRWAGRTRLSPLGSSSHLRRRIRRLLSSTVGQEPTIPRIAGIASADRQLSNRSGSTCRGSSIAFARSVLVSRAVAGGILEQSQQLEPTGERLAFIVSFTHEHSLDPPVLCWDELQDEAHRRPLANCWHARMLRRGAELRARGGPESLAWRT